MFFWWLFAKGWKAIEWVRREISILNYFETIKIMVMGWEEGRMRI